MWVMDRFCLITTIDHVVFALKKGDAGGGQPDVLPGLMTSGFLCLRCTGWHELINGLTLKANGLIWLT